MRPRESGSGLIVAARCQGLIKVPRARNGEQARAYEAPQHALAGGCVFPCRRFAAAGAQALPDRQAAFGALPCSGQAVEGIAATLAEDGSFSRNDCAIAGHCVMV